MSQVEEEVVRSDRDGGPGNVRDVGHGPCVEGSTGTPEGTGRPNTPLGGRGW